MSAQPKTSHGAPAPPGRVLATLNEDGSRRWIRPRLAEGAWWNRRRILAWFLMVLFVALPWVRLAGKPPILLDLPRREFTLIGTTFAPTETLLFMLLFISTLIGIFLLTALLGRVWCGWGCPQTVYMEFLFRPIEHWIEGGPRGAMELDAKRAWLHPKRLLKYAIFAVIATFLGNSFLAYFVGTDQLMGWIQGSPKEHPMAFAMMALVSVATFIDFTWFREQTCLVACPYGRLQSVLLDRQSLIVGYDVTRGEPRGRGGKERSGLGDCVDCSLCTQVCPTGIDIRDGLQMECIHCTQCADACDSVMVKIGKPPGLIGYTSQARLARKPLTWLRPRVVMYPLVMSVTLVLFGWLLTHRGDAEVTVLRGKGEPFSLTTDGRVQNQVRIKVANRGSRDAKYAIVLDGVDGAQVIAPMNPLPVPARRMGETSLFVMLPAGAFEHGERPVRFLVKDEHGFSTAIDYRLVGPEHDHDEEHGDQPHEAEGGEHR